MRLERSFFVMSVAALAAIAAVGCEADVGPDDGAGGGVGGGTGGGDGGVLDCSDCDANASCDDTAGVVCTCDPGFEGDGFTCTRIDPCTIGNGGCDANATCTSVEAEVSCACDDTFVGDGFACAPADTCGDGTLDATEQCDDGNNDPLDGCSAACRFELTYRITDLDFETSVPNEALGCSTDANALGARALGALALTQLNARLQERIEDGTVNVLVPVFGFNDPRGMTDDGAIEIVSLGGMIDPGLGGNFATAPDTLDWWFTHTPFTADANGLPPGRIPGSYVAESGIATIDGAGRSLSLPVSLGGTVGVLDLRNPVTVMTLVGPDAAPTRQPTPYDATVTRRPNVTANTGTQGLCGEVTAVSLSRLAVPNALTTGTFACTEGYAACDVGETPDNGDCNSLLDVLVNGCSVGLDVIPVQVIPGGADGQPDVAGADGELTPFTVDEESLKVSADQLVDNDDAYSAFMHFTAEAAHITRPTP